MSELDIGRNLFILSSTKIEDIASELSKGIVSAENLLVFINDNINNLEDTTPRLFLSLVLDLANKIGSDSLKFEELAKICGSMSGFTINKVGWLEDLTAVLASKLDLEDLLDVDNFIKMIEEMSKGLENPFSDEEIGTIVALATATWSPDGGDLDKVA